MPQCYPRNSTLTPYYPESYPIDKVILLTSKVVPQNRTDIQSFLWQNDTDPLIGKGGPQNVIYQGIMTDDAYFELYRKVIELENTTMVGNSTAANDTTASTNMTTSSNATSDHSDDLGTLVWRYGGTPFKKGLSWLVMQWDGNLVIYSVSPDDFGSVAATSQECFGLDTYYDNFYLAWLPEENQAAVFPGYWDEDLPRVWSSTEGYDNTLPYTPRDYAILNPCQRTSSVLSLIGSTLVLYMIVGRWIKRKKWSVTRDRILVGVCILDLFFSVGLGIATAATPSNFRGVVGASGSVGFCDLQGFMIQLGMAVPMYYCGLSLVFLLYVTKGKRIRIIESRVEPTIHLLVWTIAISSSVAGLVLELYNSNGQFCYIKPYPYNCETQFIDCTRGEAGITLGWFFSVGLVGVPYLGTTILMIALYYAVWDQDRKMKVRYGDAWNGNMDRLNKVKIQAFFYIGGFFVVWFWTGVRLVLAAIGIISPFWLEVVASFTLPLQGFFNFLIFVRQPLLDTKKEHSERSFAWIIVTAIKGYPFVEPDESRRNASRRRSSFQLVDRSNRGWGFSQLSGDFSLRSRSQKSRSQSQKSADSSSSFKFTNSKLFTSGESKDQEDAC